MRISCYNPEVPSWGIELEGEENKFFIDTNRNVKNVTQLKDEYMNYISKLFDLTVNKKIEY